jgi:hypothetical protein
MAEDDRGVQAATDARAHERRDAEGRLRWRIGVGLTLFFGVLAAAMSVLHYLRDTPAESPTPGPGAAPPTPAVPAPTGDRPKGRDRDGRRGD